MLCMICLERAGRQLIEMDEVCEATVMAQGHTFCTEHYMMFVLEAERHNNVLKSFIYQDGDK